MSLETAWEWSIRLACFSVFLQGIEHLQLRRKSRRDRWSALLSGIRAPLLVLLFLDPTFDGGAFFAIAVLVFSYLNSMLWGGSYNGGSDSMTLLTWLFLSLGMITGRSDGALAALAVYLSASYFLSGVSKFRISKEWREGHALSVMLKDARYLSQRDRDQFARIPGWVLRTSSWGVLSWEILFPLSWLGTPWAGVFLGIGFLFHLGNARYLGLNRFLWAWVAAYPALIFWVGKLQGAG